MRTSTTSPVPAAAFAVAVSAVAALARRHFVPPEIRGKSRPSDVESVEQTLGYLPGGLNLAALEVTVALREHPLGAPELRGGVTRVTAGATGQGPGFIFHAGVGLPEGDCPWIASEVLASAHTMRILTEDPRAPLYCDSQAPFKTKERLQAYLDSGYTGGIRAALESLEARVGFGLARAEEYVRDCATSRTTPGPEHFLTHLMEGGWMPRPRLESQALAFLTSVLALVRAPEAPDMPSQPSIVH